MNYEQRDFGGRGWTAAAPRDPNPPKIWCLAGALACAVALFFIYARLFDVPTVYVANGSERPVACMTSDMSGPAPMSDSACQEVLKGRHDKTWVAPDWRP